MNHKVIAIVAIVISTIVLVSVLPNQEALYIDYVALANPHSINIIFLTKNGKILSNVSVSLFAFYPTSNGTVIKELLTVHDTGLVKIPLSNLTDYARHWEKHYGDKVIPSLLGFASYAVVEGNETVFYVQPFTVSVSPYNVTHGIGKTVLKVFVDPQKIVVHHRGSANSSLQNDLTTTTTTTTVPGIQAAPFLFCYLNSVWFYPSNNSLGPIPISLVYVTDPNYNDYGGNILVQEGSSSQSGIQIKFGVSVLGGAYTVTIAGTSLITSASYLMITSKGFFGHKDHADTNFVETYIMGQVAIANYSIWYYCPSLGTSYPIGYQDEVFVTGLELEGSGSSYLPALYNTTTPNVNPPEYFSKNLTFLFSASGPYSGNELGEVNIVTTSEGNPAFSVPIGLIIKIAQVLGVAIPSWVSGVLLVVSPYVGIVAFTNSYQYFADYLSFTDYSYNTYYVYLMNASVPYCIGGQKYYLPFYYYYINYTSP